MGILSSRGRLWAQVRAYRSARFTTWEQSFIFQKRSKLPIRAMLTVRCAVFAGRCVRLDGVWGFTNYLGIMKTVEPTSANFDELLAYLPILYADGFKPIARLGWW